MRNVSHLLANGHALIPVNEQTVGLHFNIVFQPLLVSVQRLQGRLSFSQTHSKTIDGGANLSNFAHKTVLYWVTAQLNVGSQGAFVQAGVGHLQWSFLIRDCPLQVPDVVLHGSNLVHDLGRAREGTCMRKGRGHSHT